VGAPNIVRVEVERPSGRLREWEDAHSAHFGRIDPALREQEGVRCLPIDKRPFAGRIEYGALGETLLCKVAATKFRLTRSMTTPAPTLPAPLMLVSVSRGSVNFVERGPTCILTEGDWALIDSKLSRGYEISSPEFEAFVTMLPRPSDAAIVALCERGVAHRWNGRAGLSRVLLAMVNESFGEMRCLPGSSGRKLGAAIVTMAWDALREEIEIGRRDDLLKRVKAYIEAKLADPELSVEQIAHACGISVRGLHRHFAEDPAGSVSHYLWRRRLVRCAEALRDPSWAHLSVTDVCFSYGFSSSSHFSRLFKDRFGVPPVRYRSRSPAPFG
jgi:AraC family transcriptional activator of tynA and feaB